ncbi:hypothetical protein F6O75_09065 [Streptococcus suis]|uniref:Uncharacterized protein n=1 Tax=Streptococcus suis (strain BM407) TaxID=568814 RepID=A0A0H3N1J4_STRS4|nr:hypothetical protein AA105_00510 [Streptococcus suis]CAR44254.1 hypothetical protein SSU0084 [Streptococcus suis P1/7]CAZ50856.1 hypothetical protein SSUSC84_0080 [Streptococcus suis SC84]CAZ54912.1 hypothetical protein SSUBM407_0080 [Streptococcus suis BM407]AML45615.1 hypothetical protein APQ97_00435 [Streptococcus suis]
MTDKVKIGTLAKNACVLDRVIFFTQAVARVQMLGCNSIILANSNFALPIRHTLTSK